MKNKNTTPKPVNKNPVQKDKEINQEYLQFLNGTVMEMRHNDLPVIQEELGFHKEKFATHRDKINEVASELNAMSEQTHERLLALARSDAAMFQVMDNQFDNLDRTIAWNRFSIWALAVIQVIVLIKLFI
jgi:hypothetical protein